MIRSTEHAHILRAGLMMTVQDAGRQGLLRFGVSGSGAMDPQALQMANALVGNPLTAAAVEFAHVGGTLRFDDDRCIAVCGAVTEMLIAGRPVAPWQSHLIRAGEVLSIGAMRETVWGYLAVSGGFDTPEVLGARATHLRTRLGGVDGRVLTEGDAVPLGLRGAAPKGQEPQEPGPQDATGTAPDLWRRADAPQTTQVHDPACNRRLHRPWRGRSGPIHIVLGPQADHFAPEIVARLLRSPYRVGQKRDRMAMVLEGPALPAARGHDIISDGTVAGSVQVPGSGQPMVLMADRQTTGGYPKIATVATVDLPRLAQMPAGAHFRFRAISAAVAEDMLIAQRRAFAASLADLDAPPDDAATARARPEAAP
ncbi:biotin-dependent carboxyltransferase family protein [Phaeovulum sp. W22_SRMD_FR3]|uniref:5-oxoprolinase subunit C family protein n=1 Tax=Phaeovulum sp. W22_SRMD_FR3 TaxID=3240274 RepID=UPI003F9D1C16